MRPRQFAPTNPPPPNELRTTAPTIWTWKKRHGAAAPAPACTGIRPLLARRGPAKAKAADLAVRVSAAVGQRAVGDGLNQSEACAALGLPHDHAISNWERATSLPRPPQSRRCPKSPQGPSTFSIFGFAEPAFRNKDGRVCYRMGCK